MAVGNIIRLPKDFPQQRGIIRYTDKKTGTEKELPFDYTTQRVVTLATTGKFHFLPRKHIETRIARVGSEVHVQPGKFWNAVQQWGLVPKEEGDSPRACPI